MPYIKMDERQRMDTIVELIHTYNVPIYNLLLDFFKDMSYNGAKNYIGELRQCVIEIRRRMNVGWRLWNRKRYFNVHLSGVGNIIEAMKRECIKVNGDLNYILYAYCLRYVKDRWQYCRDIEAVVKRLQEELALYEDRKIRENGDII